MKDNPFYNPYKSYKENYDEGPFGYFATRETYKQKRKLAYDFLGHKLFTPFGIPAGPLLNAKFCKAALKKGFDIVTYKTVRSHWYPAHEWPNVLHVKTDGTITFEQAEKGVLANHQFGHPLSITNSFGVPSYDPDIWQKDLHKLVKITPTGQIVIGSFQGTLNKNHDVKKYIDDFKTTAKLVVETGVPIIEANLSCPNEGSKNLLCFDIERTIAILSSIRDVIGRRPLLIKIAYFYDGHHLRKFIKSVGSLIDGISAINTIPAKIVDEKGQQKLPGEGRLWSGVCGLAIRWAGLEMVKKIKKIRDDLGYQFVIVGVGGVITPEDYFKYRKTGADAVMSATGSMWNPYLAQEIKSSMDNDD